ncbi:glycosyltransferase [bacterium]|nr:MAG: glycosyltransferase [bacterium]QQR61765.1 MAG: glycosyltransferase [bacterium]
MTLRFPHISQTFIQNQIITLLKRGHQIKIQALKRNNHEKIQSDFSKYNLLKKTKYGTNIQNLHNTDVIYIQFGDLGAKLLSQIKNKQFKGGVVVCFRGNDISGILNKNPHMYDDLFKQADLFLPVCDFFKERLISLGCPAEKIITHHSAIETKKFTFKERAIKPDQRLNLISVARIAPKKGLEYTIQAVAHLKQTYPHIRCTVIGEAQPNHLEYKRYLKALVKELGIEENVIFYGWAKTEDIIKELNTSDIFVLPSVTAQDGDQEGIPNALKEAMAVGLPVIATDHAGNSELIDHMQSGILVEEKNVEAITNAIEWILENQTSVKQMTKNARKKIEDEFDIESVITKLEYIFDTLIKEKKRASHD